MSPEGPGASLRRTAFTLVELVVVLALGTLVFLVVQEAMVLVARGQDSASQRANTVLVRARLAETLLRDVRSTYLPPVEMDGGFRLIRYRHRGSALERAQVDWRYEASGESARLRRIEEGGPTMTFDFLEGEVLPEGRVLGLRLVVTDDAQLRLVH